MSSDLEALVVWVNSFAHDCHFSADQTSSSLASSSTGPATLSKLAHFLLSDTLFSSSTEDHSSSSFQQFFIVLTIYAKQYLSLPDDVTDIATKNEIELDHHHNGENNGDDFVTRTLQTLFTCCVLSGGETVKRIRSIPGPEQTALHGVVKKMMPVLGISKIKKPSEHTSNTNNQHQQQQQAAQQHAFESNNNSNDPHNQTGSTPNVAFPSATARIIADEELRAAKQRVEELLAANSSLEDKVDSLSTELQSAEAEQFRLQTKYKEAVSQSSSSTAIEIKELKNDILKKERELAEASEDVDRTKKLLNDARSENSSSNEELQSVKRQNQSLSDELTKLKANSSSSTLELRSALEKIEQLEITKNDLEGKVLVALDKQNSVEQETAGANKKLSVANEKIEDLERLLAECKKSLERAESENKSAAEQLERALEENNEKLQLALKEKDTKITELSLLSDKRKQELDEALLRAKNAAEESGSESAKLIEDLQAQLRRLQLQFDESEASRVAQNEELVETREKLANKESEFASFQTSQESLINSLKHKQQSEQNGKEEADHEIQNLRDQFEQERKDFARQLQHLQEKELEAQRQFSSNQQEMAEMHETEKQKLRNELTASHQSEMKNAQISADEKFQQLTQNHIEALSVVENSHKLSSAESLRNLQVQLDDALAQNDQLNNQLLLQAEVARQENVMKSNNNNNSNSCETQTHVVVPASPIIEGKVEPSAEIPPANASSVREIQNLRDENSQLKRQLVATVDEMKKQHAVVVSSLFECGQRNLHLQTQLVAAKNGMIPGGFMNLHASSSSGSGAGSINDPNISFFEKQRRKFAASSLEAIGIAAQTGK